MVVARAVMVEVLGGLVVVDSAGGGAVLRMWQAQFKAPFTVLLVMAGLVMAATTQTDVNISVDLILGVFVPPLVLEATMQLPWRRLRNDLVSILTVAIGGTCRSLRVGDARDEILACLTETPPAALLIGIPVELVATDADGRD